MAERVVPSVVGKKVKGDQKNEKTIGCAKRRKKEGVRKKGRILGKGGYVEKEKTPPPQRGEGGSSP